MRSLLVALLTIWAAPAFAEVGPVAGRMSCEITHVRFVASHGGAIAGRQDLFSGMTLTFDYFVAEGGGLTLVMGSPDHPKDLISETFAAGKFRGISRFAGSAEFRAAYSEASLGRYGINYKGSDQLYLRNCGERLWQGQFVRPHVSGLFTQVLSLSCSAQVDAIDTILDRLAGMHSL